jgi:phenylalanyl-tRNA synthetase beta chain
MFGKGKDFFTLKGVIQELFKKMGVSDVKYVAEASDETYHPGRCARLMAGEQCIGIMGEIHPDAAANFGLDGVRVYCCELMFGAVARKAKTEIVYQPLPKYPSTSRDIALLVDEEMEVGKIEDVIREKGKSILESVRLFDVYRGKQVEEGKKSVAFALVFRDPERTLKDEEVREKQENVVAALEKEFGAELRKM